MSARSPAPSVQTIYDRVSFIKSLPFSFIYSIVISSKSHKGNLLWFIDAVSAFSKARFCAVIPLEEDEKKKEEEVFCV